MLVTFLLRPAHHLEGIEAVVYGVPPMTSAHLTRWIKATDTRRATPRPASMRACLHSAVATMQSSIKAFTPVGQDAAFSSCVGDQRALESSTDVAPNGGLARIMVA